MKNIYMTFAISFMVSTYVLAEDIPVVETTPPPGPAAEKPKSPTTIPNQRELSEEEYKWLGNILWKKMESSVDPNKKDLSEEDLNKMIDDMQRNRGELPITLEDLKKLKDSAALCKQNNGAPGIPLDNLIKIN